MATLEEIMAALNAGGSASNMSSADLATLMSGGGAMSSGTPSPYTEYGGTNAWTDPNSPEFKSRMDTLTNTMLSGQRNQVEDYVRRAALSGVQRGGYNVAGAPNYAGGLQKEAINALAGGYDTRYTNALNYLMSAGTLNEKGIERSFTAEQNSKQQAATAALQAAGFDQQTAERLAAQQFSSGEAATQRGWQSGENTLGREFTAGENEKQHVWQSGENVLGRNFTTSERLGTQGFQAGQTSNQQNWQAAQNTAQLEQQKAIADQNYQLAIKNAATAADAQAAEQKYREEMLALERQRLAAGAGSGGGGSGSGSPSGSGSGGGGSGSGSPSRSGSGGSGSGSGSPSGSGSGGGGSGSGGGGPAGLGPSSNTNAYNGQGYDPNQMYPIWEAPYLISGAALSGYNSSGTSQDLASWYDDYQALQNAQQGADQGSFAPTPEEYQNSWTGSTNNDYYDNNYDSGGQSYNNSWSDFG